MLTTFEDNSSDEQLNKFNRYCIPLVIARRPQKAPLFFCCFYIPAERDARDPRTLYSPRP
jgi:hypothetical protein